MTRGLVLLLAFGLSGRAWALGQDSFVGPTGAFPLAGASLEIDPADWPGVARAANDLRSDLERVFGDRPASGRKILVGTLGKSPAIDRLAAEGKIDVSGVLGQWEAYDIETVGDMLVIAGSDKRGAIYGLYEISEQIGVSPWYWWADVPVRHQDALYVAAGRHLGKPSAVKYRGIFLNDEAPALSGWAKEKFGTLDHRFYGKVFELILRLRGNFLWPAMWDNAFNEDDPENPKLADAYGIVMGTSHHEPMLRAQQEWKRHGTGPWNYATNGEVLRNFWAEGIRRNKDFESLVTIGMRGDGDMPMTESEQEADTKLLERIVADQRAILGPDVPQVWALYKEVQLYYEKGMRVPDDVTLLWCDDNWGNIRRLPTPEERKRPGGAGIYYHFDYVGDPRNYKWINTNPISKVWEQMHLARDYGADRLWVVNVGDLKPMEFPIEFFLSMARDPESWPKERLRGFTESWAAPEFGPGHAAEIADIVTRRDRYVGRRKPELLDRDTFSLTAYHEADRVAEEYRTLVADAERVGRQLPRDMQDAYFELVLHPVKAAAIVTGLYIAAGKGDAATTQALFAADQALSDRYNHEIAGGKWDHMMDQTHIGYSGWQQPDINTPPAVRETAPVDVSTESGYVSIEAEHYSAKIDGKGVAWEKIPDYGRTLSAMEPYPSTEASFASTKGAPRLDYRMYLKSPSNVTVQAILGPSLGFVPGRGLRYAIAFDQEKPQVVDYIADNSKAAWERAVSDNVRVGLSHHRISAKGWHTLKIWMVDPGVALEKLVVDLGGLRPSYLGPPEGAP
jgi:hypothetical protein